MYLQEFTLFAFDLDFRIKVEGTLNVAQYSLQHATYALAKFEVATSNGLGEGRRTFVYLFRFSFHRVHLQEQQGKMLSALLVMAMFGTAFAILVSLYQL